MDGYPAGQRATDDYVPIPIAVAVTKNGKAIEFVPESFALVDAQGNVVLAAGYRELLGGYEKIGFDRSLIRLRPIVVGSYVADLRPIAASFYPPADSGTRTARVELASFTWFVDTIYFPRPPAGLGGIYADGGEKYYVSAGVLKDVQLKTAFHIQVAYKAPWDEIGGSASQFPEYPPA